jgi:hypothetical protein
MRFLKAAALLLAAIAFVPSGAHLLELPGKLALPLRDYFAVQSIYAGWQWFGLVWLLTIGANLWLGARLRRFDAVAARSAFASAGMICLSLIIFFIWILPANRATGNWTNAVAGWEALRPSWEYGHAANAVLMLIALILTIAACVRETPAAR